MTNQEAVKMLRTIKGTVYLGNRKFEDAISYAISALEQPIEPQRMRGRWVEDGYNDEKAVCDQCGEPCATYIMGEPRDRYCKWCGADMREGQDEVN